MNITLRPWHINDLENLVALANNPNIARNLTDQFPSPYTKENGLKFIEFASSNEPLRIFAIDLDGESIGGIGLHPQSDIERKNAELGYWLGEPFWGKGIISKVVPQIVEYGFAHLDLHRIFARPFGRNIASQKVLEKAGFSLEAKLKDAFYKNKIFEDAFIYSILKK
jgi:ribosomal-protein-alanine N-acetyltransferase